MRDLFVLMLNHYRLLIAGLVVLAVVWFLIGAALSTWMNARALRKRRREHGHESAGNHRDTDF